MSIVSALCTGTSVVSGTWTNATTLLSADNSFASQVTARSTSYYIDCTNFGFDSLLPANATINKVTLETKWYASVAASNCAILGLQAYVSGGMVGSYGESYTNAPTTAKVVTYDAPITTRAQLLNSAFKVRLRSGRGSSQTAATTYFDYAKVTVDYSIPKPVITIQGQDLPKVSDETGKTRCTVTFTASEALSYWEARATHSGATPGHGVGLLIESGSLGAGATGTVYADYSELNQGDREYRIDVFGQNGSGVWSDG